MNFALRPGWMLIFALAFAARPVRAVTVNDGTSTNGLVQVSNVNGNSSGAVDTLDAGAGGVLVAAQSAVETDFPLRSAWYAGGLSATTGVYTVSADFQPAADDPANRGGVMGWISLASTNGIVLQVIPSDPLAGGALFRVSVVDFSADSPEANDSFAHLYDTNGAAATDASAVTAPGAAYAAAGFARFQLAFGAPTAADLAARSNATAHITAKVFQGTNAAAPAQVGATVELLTDLALPPAAAHRFGYFAVWGSSFGGGDVIGNLDNLSAEGGVGAPPNVAPTVQLTAPSDGASFTEPASITLTADATDSDGTVTRVDFLAGATLLGAATNAPFTIHWTGVPAGSYLLRALATDNTGLTTTSAPVNVTVSTSTGTGPTLTVVRNGNTVEVSWPTSGYQLQMKTNLLSTTWTDVPNTVNTNRATIQVSGDAVFFRLLQAGNPSGPQLTVQINGGTVAISWPSQVTGYRLQAKDSLAAATWTDIPTTGNQFSEAASAGSRFYRLISP